MHNDRFGGKPRISTHKLHFVSKVAGEHINRSTLGVIHSLMLWKYLYMAHLGFVGFRMQSPVYKCSPFVACATGEQ